MFESEFTTPIKCYNQSDKHVSFEVKVSSAKMYNWYIKFGKK